MPENQNIEWKEFWPDEYLKWICGFANAQSGKIYIGIDDTRKVIGIRNGQLTRAAVLLFHRMPQKWMFGTYTKVGKFGKGADLQYQDEVIGSLFMQAEHVIELIYLKYLTPPLLMKI